jgi:hypothetical protein
MSSAHSENGRPGAKDAQGEEGGQGQGAAAIHSKEGAAAGGAARQDEALARAIAERIQRVEEQIAAWRRRNSQSNPAAVWDLRELKADLRHWQEMAAALR